ncbi:MAG: hypothetical protein ACRETG_10990 [Steroidobacteraceae bacterium]
MAVERKSSKKAPSQNPVSFFQCDQHGGTHGMPAQRVPDKLTSGPVREKIYGRPDLGKQ